jgi:YD repeat-containing protein
MIKILYKSKGKFAVHAMLWLPFVILICLFTSDPLAAVEWLPAVQTYECDSRNSSYRTGKWLSWSKAFDKVLEDQPYDWFFTITGAYYDTVTRDYDGQVFGLCMLPGYRQINGESGEISLDAIDVMHCSYRKDDELITIGDPGIVDGVLMCSVTKACDCNENLEGGECVPMEEQYSMEYEPNVAKLYQYPTNNQGQRCPPVDYDELDGCKNDRTSSPGTGFGNPIDCATGQKVQIETDYQGAGADPLRYTRVYQSPLSDDPDAEPTTGLPWLNTAQPALSLQTLGDGAQLGIFTIGHQVKRVLFNASGGSGWSSNHHMDPIGMGAAGAGRGVTYNGKVYRLNDAGQTEASEENGIQRYTYHYNDEGKLAEIRNRFGAFLQFTYDDDNRLTRLTDQAGTEIHYTYDNHGNLSEVIYPDDTPGELSDNPRKTYLYENSAFPYHLTGVIDESGLQFARFAYDANGRGILTEHADGAGRVTISYPEAGQAIVRFYRDTNTETYREEAYTYGKFRGAYRLTSRTIQVCDDCTLGSESWTYDYQGLLLNHEDMRGHETTYIYDEAGRKLSETAAAGTNLARTTRYTWDEELHKLLTITTDDSVTTFNYDTNGMLQSKTVTPVQ